MAHRAVVDPAWMDAVVDGELEGKVEGEAVALPDAVAHRFARVLRLTEGAAVELIDGRGRIAEAQFAPPGHVAAVRVHTEDALLPPLVVAQAMTTADKLEQVVQRACELGASEVLLFVAERSQVRLDVERAEKRRERLGRVATDAARQCGRARAPLVEGPASFAALVERVRAFPGVAATGVVTAERTWSDLLASERARAQAGALFVVGPEGGLADRELEALAAAGARGARIGVHILRTETAALAALAAAQAHFGRL